MPTDMRTARCCITIEQTTKHFTAALPPYLPLRFCAAPAGLALAALHTAKHRCRARFYGTFFASRAAHAAALRAGRLSAHRWPLDLTSLTSLLSP